MRGKDNLLLEVKALKKYYPVQKGLMRKHIGDLKAVDNVSFFIKDGESLGLVGESGCGKTTTGRCILRAIEPSQGQILFKDQRGEVMDVGELDAKKMRLMRREMQMIFQDPYSSLDSRMTMLDIIGEPFRVHRTARGKELEDRVKALVSLVGLDIKHLKRYPHAFSGGQRQRIGIARALALNPRFIVADEPVSALDVSVQAQILNLMQDLQEKRNLAYLFITHDLAVIEHISDRVAVMYVGKIVEVAETEELFQQPQHPYTEALLSAVPKPDPRLKMKRVVLSGEVANPANPPSGCYFHPRCRYAKERCKAEEPGLREVMPDHYTACHFAEKLELL
jgi:peptide/nickel transport system ATP-binding protein